ncbi:hypothetical protein P154DRAFT_625762 [Amniculicola lignicola CBS 123094]|uniref:Uncharacterized protein n=1 Tax=Amniculicola lignicola CBS 123094 TaxID=1392246 RepID=A0A6A5VWA2_9PLEO|nr:hypothetical protein P154DRAFT_625762 [Amniculicola lignicola CBS 123094]
MTLFDHLPLDFHKLPEETILHIVSELQLLNLAEEKARKTECAAASYARDLTRPRANAKYKDLLTFCQLSKKCRRIGQEVLVRHPDLTEGGKAATQVLRLLRLLLFDNQGLATKVRELKLDLTVDWRDKETVASMLEQNPTLWGEIVKRAALVHPALVDLWEAEWDEAAREEIPEPRGHEAVDEEIPEPGDEEPRMGRFEGTKAVQALILHTTNLEKLDIADSQFQSKSLRDDVSLVLFVAWELKALKTLVLRSRLGSSDLISAFLEHPEVILLPRLKTLDLRIQEWVGHSSLVPLLVQNAGAEPWKVESLILRGWVGPEALALLLRRFEALKSLKIVVDVHERFVPMEMDEGEFALQFDMLWEAMLAVEHTLESFEFVVKRRRTKYPILFPPVLNRMEKLKVFKISGAVLFRRPFNPVSGLVEEGVVAVDSFLPPNLEHFEYAPDPISLGQIVDLCWVTAIIPRPAAGAMREITACFKQLLQILHQARPSIQSIVIPWSWYSPTDFVEIEAQLRQHGVKLLRKSKKEEMEQIRKAYEDKYLAWRPDLMEQLALYGGVEDNYHLSGELQKRDRNRDAEWEERESRVDAQGLGAELVKLRLEERDKGTQ